jgi:hypothetical protein
MPNSRELYVTEHAGVQQGTLTVKSGVSTEAAPAKKLTAADVKANLEKQLRAAYEKALTKPRAQIAEPLFWWEIFALGPIQAGAQLVPPATFLSSPLLPGKVIRKGETGFIVTFFILNPFPLPQDPLIIPSDFLSVFSLPFEIDYHTCNGTTCEPAGANLNVKHTGNLVPGQFFYVDVLEFVAEDPGCIFETNICARILGCDGKTPNASPFAGFARTTINVDPELFFPTPLLEFDNPVRFMVYE